MPGLERGTGAEISVGGAGGFECHPAVAAAVGTPVLGAAHEGLKGGYWLGWLRDRCEVELVGYLRFEEDDARMMFPALIDGECGNRVLRLQTPVADCIYTIPSDYE